MIAMPISLCQCGCGHPAPIAPQTDRKRGYIKGQPRRFIRGHSRKHPLPRDGKRWCPSCQQWKSDDAFVAKYTAEKPLAALPCKECYAQRSREWQRKNPDRHRRNGRNYRLRMKYGLTIEDYERILAEQEGLCAICRQNPARDVDHDHATGAVRKLLCNGCNRVLGLVADDAERLRAAAAYLEEYKTP